MPRTPRIAAIVCAAGSGTRFGSAAGSKLDQDLHGKPVLVRAVEAVARQPAVIATLVAGPADPTALEAFRGRYERELHALHAVVCPGGVVERYETVRAALDYLRGHGPQVDAVLIHDAARPCASPALVRGVIDALRDHRAVVPAVPVADTLKRVSAEPTRGEAEASQTIDRRGLFACQTPQGFDLGLLTRAYAQANLASTDDAQLVERLGEPVMLVPGDARNLKITRPGDMVIARALWPTLEAGGGG